MQVGDLEKVSKLLQDGCDPNSYTEDGTPLLAKAQQAEMVKLLFDAGAKINMLDMHGRIALFFAVCSYYRDVVRELISCGIDINLPDENGHTPLWYAEDIELVEILLRNGANASDAGNALIINAIDNNSDAVLKLVDANAPINFRDAQGCTALIYASGYGHVSIMNILLNANADIDAVDNDGETALMWGAAHGELVGHLPQKPPLFKPACLSGYWKTCSKKWTQALNRLLHRTVLGPHPSSLTRLWAS